MRLMILCGNFQLGGAETVAADLTGALVARGHHVVVASVRSGGPMADAFAARGAKVYDGLARRSVDPLAAFRFAGVVRREAIDCLVVLDPLRNGLLYAIVGCLLSGRRVRRVCWCHSWPGGQAGRFRGRLAAYLHLGLLSAIVCVSRAQQRHLAGRLLRKRLLPVVSNGVDSARFAACARHAKGVGQAESPQTVLQIANFMPDKDFDILLRAAAILAGQRSDFRLVLAGRGTDGPELASAIASAGLQGVVEALGPRMDVPELLAVADVFVLASKRETFGLAVLEAMAAGVPVVVSDLPAFDDLFQVGVEGLKAPVGDASAMAAAIAKLLDDGALAARISQAGRKRAAAFSVDAMADRMERLLVTVCGNGPWAA